MCDKCPPKELYPGDYPDFTRLGRTRRIQVIDIADKPRGVLYLGDNEFDIMGTRGPRATIYWNGRKWRCKSCGGNATFQTPCLHQWGLWLHLALVARAERQPPFPDKLVDQAAYDLSRRNHQEIEPQLIRDLVATMVEPEPADSGPAAIPERELMMGAIAFVWCKAGMRDTESILKTWGERGLLERPFAYSYISEYMGRPDTLQKVMRLLLLSAVTTKGFTFSGGSDGTGIQRLNWAPYRSDSVTKHRLQEQRRRARKHKKAMRTWRIEVDRCKKIGVAPPPQPAPPKTPPELDAKAIEELVAKHGIEVERCLQQGIAPPPAPVYAERPKARGYLTAIPWYFYETNLVPCVVIRPRSPLEYETDGDDEGDEDDGFWNAESPYFLGMLDLMRPHFPQLRQVRADGALYKFTHFLYGKSWGIDMQIPIPSTFRPGAGDGKAGAGRKAVTEAFARYKEDPLRHYKDFHKRSHQEGCQNGFKLTTGAGIRTREETQQLVEASLKFLVWNVRQLNYHMHARDNWRPDFAAAAVEVDADPWMSVEQRSLKFRGKDAESLIMKEAWAAKDAAGEEAAPS